MAQFTIRPAGQQDEIDNITKTAMSKATFEAIARDNRDKFAGSGFVEWGKHYNYALTPNINYGMWAGNASDTRSADHFELGTSSSASLVAGLSKSNFPLVNINGTTLKIDGINYDSADRTNHIHLPPAPTVYPTGTTNHLITEGLAIAHADASNSGLIVNGKFDTDTTVNHAGHSATIAVVGNRLEVTATGLNGADYYTMTTVVGKTYVAEVLADQGTSGNIPKFYAFDGATILSSVSQINGYMKIEFTATTIATILIMNTASTAGGQISYFDNLACFPKDAISRSDLVFLESWHEDTSEKGVLFDLGNVQYKGTRSVGSAGTFAGSDTYSLFGNWQTAGDLVGNSIDIATLTGAQLEDFVGNPENNCYYDGDKLIQVRYRVRTVGGLGDEWANVDTQYNDGYSALRLLHSSYVKAKGKNTNITSETDTTPYYIGVFGNSFDSVTKRDNGVFTIRNTQGAGYAYEGKCYALPIALVHRRNQGAYHPVFNANGTKAFLNIDTTTSAHWYNTDQSVTSISDCFDA